MTSNLDTSISRSTTLDLSKLPLEPYIVAENGGISDGTYEVIMSLVLSMKPTVLGEPDLVKAADHCIMVETSQIEEAAERAYADGTYRGARRLPEGVTGEHTGLTTRKPSRDLFFNSPQALAMSRELTNDVAEIAFAALDRADAYGAIIPL